MHIFFLDWGAPEVPDFMKREMPLRGIAQYHPVKS